MVLQFFLGVLTGGFIVAILAILLWNTILYALRHPPQDSKDEI